MSFYLLLIILGMQRISELLIGERNLRLIYERLAAPIQLKEKYAMVALHSAWFLSVAIEFFWHGSLVSPIFFAIGISVLLACQFIRYQVISSLNQSWVHLPIAFYEQKLITNGLYRFIRHPNYLVVIIEIALVPLLGKAYFTAIIFSVINFIFLMNRIKIEEKNLEIATNYRERFAMKKKLIPFIFMFAAMIANAEELKFNHPDYDTAKKADTYFMFAGHSKKLGIIGSTFEGYAKNFSLKFTKEKDELKNVSLILTVADLDTDNDSRNDKMRNTCLNMKDFANVEVNVEDPIALTKETQEVKGSMKVRGETVPLKLKISKKDGAYLGESEFKLTDAKIPDPSIAIASVKDIFELKFQVKLPEKK